MVPESLPTRQLSERPDLAQLKRQAKELLDAFRSGNGDAVAEVNVHYRDANPATFALHDAQLVLARAYGFASWPKLKAYVDGVTVKRLVDAVGAGDLPRVQAMLEVRPELAQVEIDNMGAIHVAVLNRAPELVRLLMQYGASAREGVYPHRDATTALTLATERGYEEIVAIIHEEERRRREAKSGLAGAPAPEELFRAMTSGGDDHAIALMEASPALIHTSNAEGWTPLHLAAGRLNERLVSWLLSHGADPDRRDRNGLTPLDAAASLVARRQRDSRDRFGLVAGLLRRHGAALTDRAAVALGEHEWIRARHVERGLAQPVDGSPGGLLRIAVTHDRADMLALLLELGLDPDERVRVGGIDGVEYSWGFPLWECAATGKHAMAEMLLEHGADPNAQVYASGTPVSQAYGQADERMIALLESYRGLADASLAALYRRTELAVTRFARAVDKKTEAEGLLWSAACGGDPTIVRLALDHVDWPRDDPRWFGILEQPLRIWNHGPGHWCRPDWDRTTYQTCFRLVLERCDPNIRGRLQDQGRFGLTILHSVAGSRPHVTPGERTAFATMLLNAGARLDVRDSLLHSTPLGWACRWGRVELVKLFLDRGADPVEAEAEPWATPRAWAQKAGHAAILALL